jgi:hypothetical protein
LGDLRIKPAALWRLTWREYCAIAGGWHRRQIRQYHHTRYLAAMLVNVNMGPDGTPVDPAELLPLPGDPPPPEPMSLEELDAELARIAELDKDLTWPTY